MIFTADDFGLDPAVNAAVESAHRDGVLNTASLMVGASAAADAVARARTMPELHVGLHLTLVDGCPVLPAQQVPDLVDSSGHFAADLWWRGVRYFFIPRVRRQLAAEIRAQFAAFQATGLPLDHANAHKHLHLHPTVLSLMLRIGREFGLRAVRLPWEPLAAARCGGAKGLAPALWSFFLSPWLRLMRRRLRRFGMAHNDALFGLTSTGVMDEATLLRALACIPEGASEIYFHPALTRSALLQTLMPGYRHDAEWVALCSPEIAQYLQAQHIQKVHFSDLVVH